MKISESYRLSNNKWTEKILEHIGKASEIEMDNLEDETLGR